MQAMRFDGQIEWLRQESMGMKNRQGWTSRSISYLLLGACSASNEQMERRTVANTEGRHNVKELE